MQVGVQVLKYIEQTILWHVATSWSLGRLDLKMVLFLDLPLGCASSLGVGVFWFLSCNWFFKNFQKKKRRLQIILKFLFKTWFIYIELMILYKNICGDLKCILNSRLMKKKVKMVKVMKFTFEIKSNHLLLSSTFDDKFWRSHVNILHLST